MEPAEKRQETGKTENKETTAQSRTTNPQPVTSASAGTETHGGTRGGMGQRTPQQTHSQPSGVGQQSARAGTMGAAGETLSQAYDQTSRALNDTYQQAVDYGREHPGQTALICFGVGVGVGLLLSGALTTRSRTSRIVPPVMNAISQITNELLR